MLTILTPTYNRDYTLDRVYNSLLEQTNKSFEWLIIDDGSNDNTYEVVSKFIDDGIIKIRYFYKENGGKHTALNYGLKKVSTKYVLILDSDDYLKEDCIEIVLDKWKKYDKNKKIGCLSFLKMFPNDKVIGKRYREKEIVSNHIDFRYNKSLLGDMSEVFKSSILKKYPFPVYEGEKFLSEAIVWNKIAVDYDTVYINYPIYVANYLEDGLSKNILKLRYNNPIGAMENANIFLGRRFKFTIRLKNAILYDGFSKLSKRNFKDTIKNSNNKFLTFLLYPVGFIFYLWLKFKI